MTRTKYQVAGRLDDLEKAVGRLEFDLKQVQLKPGPPGESVQGPKGERGPAGNNAVCKCLSPVPGPVVVGPQGLSIKGDRGERGPAGVNAPDQTSAITDLSKQVAALTAIINGIADREKNTGQYLEFLRARAAARGKQ
jgi:hypothetical protein